MPGVVKPQAASPVGPTAISPPVPPSELAVMLQPGASPAVRMVAEQLAESCAEERPEAA